MSSKKCPQCGLTNFADALACKRCTADLSSVPAGLQIEPVPASRPEPTIAQQAVSETTAAVVSVANTQFSAGNVFAVLIWLGATGAFCLIFLTLQSDFARAESAPQQCAAAAINVGYAILVYCIARGLTLTIRAGQGK